MQHPKVKAASTLLGQMRALLDHNDISDNVKKAWLYWARSLMLFHAGREPESFGIEDVQSFVRHLEVDRRASPASLRQALEAVRYLLDEVLDLDIPGLDALVQCRLRGSTPSVLSPREVQQFLSCLEGEDWLIASLIYGAGLRLLECIRLRIRDIDSERIIVRDRNGRFKRESLLPARVREPLRAHIEDRKLEHIRELADGYGAAQMPGPNQVSPTTARSWVCQFVFPGPYLSASPPGQVKCWRSHRPESEVRHALSIAAGKAGLAVQVSDSTLRNSFALHLIERGVAKADVERLLGLERGPDDARRGPDQSGSGSTSPVDRLFTH